MSFIRRVGASNSFMHSAIRQSPINFSENIECMARSILGTSPVPQTLSRPLNPATSNLSHQAVQARLRQKRSKSYLDAVTQLDAGGHLCGTQSVEALLEAIRQELPDIAVDALPVGIVSKCYLGPPYEVHTLDLSGGIIRHYKVGEGLPALMERARTLAVHPIYAFIEVYSTKLIAVSANGKTAVIES